MIIEDDRSPEERVTHPYIVAANDSFMSGWGYGMPVSIAAWACKPEDVNKVLAMVRGRREMKRPRVIVSPKWRPRGEGHTHIYVWNG